MRRSTPSSPDWSGRWRCGSVRGAPSTQAASSSSSTCWGSIELSRIRSTVCLDEDPAHEAREGEGGSRVRAAMAALRPAAVVGPDVDPGEDDLAMARAEGPPDVREHRVRRQRPLGAAGLRDDAVGAVERAAVLDLDEGPRALDRRAVVGDPVDRAVPRPESVGSGPACTWPAPGCPCPSIASSASSSARNAALPSLPTSRASASIRANASGPTWTEQPVTTISASGLARRARRTAARDFSSAVAVTVQVLTRYEVGAGDRGRRAGPRPRGAAAPRLPSPTG